MKVNILHQGDKVLQVTNDFIAVRRKDKTVDLVPLTFDEFGLRVDVEHITTIGFGHNEVIAENDRMGIINF